RNIEGLEADVEAARSEVFAAVNAATALRHAMEHAAAAKVRMAEQISRLEVERGDLRIQADRAERERSDAEESTRRAGEAMQALELDRTAKDLALAASRAERDGMAQDLRTRERDVAGLTARLKSLEELD